MTKGLVIAAVIGSLTACGGDGGPTAPTVPPAQIAGSYSLTITAAPSCSATLPFPILGFAATVTQAGTSVQMALVGHAPGTPAGNVSGTVNGQTLSFSTFPLSEAMGRGATLNASGNATVATGGLKITGTLNGTFQVPSGPNCNSTSHQMELVKLCPQQTATGTALLPCQQ